MARSEGLSNWVPVSQIIGNIPVPLRQPVQAQPSFAMFPSPPNLHWGLVLLFGVLSCFLFFVAWQIVLGVWMRKVLPTSKALFLYITAAGIAWGTSFLVGIVGSLVPGSDPSGGFVVILAVANVLLQLTGIAIGIWARFSMRADLEKHFTIAEPYNLHLSGVMTFFFDVIYFQYHLNNIAEWKRAAQMQSAYAARV